MLVLRTIHPQTKQRRDLLIYRVEADTLLECNLIFIESGTLEDEESCIVMPTETLLRDPGIAFDAIIYYLRAKAHVDAKKKYLEPHI